MSADMFPDDFWKYVAEFDEEAKTHLRNPFDPNESEYKSWDGQTYTERELRGMDRHAFEQVAKDPERGLWPNGYGEFTTKDSGKRAEFEGGGVRDSQDGTDLGWVEEYPDQSGFTPRGELLMEARSLIEGDRNKTYGSPTENFKNTADIWNALLGHKMKDGARITPTEVATLMVGLKLARTIAQPKRDNFVDMAGYAACGWETQSETVEGSG